MSGRGAERILDLVEWMAGQVAPFGLADAAQAMATPKSSMLLLLRTLVDRGYAERLPDGRYALARLPGEMGSTGRAWNTLLRVAEPALRAAVDAVRETGFVAVLDEGKVRYLNKLLPDREIRYDRDITAPRAPHQVASGIVLMAWMPADERAALIAALDTDHAALEADLTACRANGFFYNGKGVVEGAAGVAAPVFGADGRALAAINISGPRDRVAAQIDSLSQQTVQTAARVTEELQRRTHNKRIPGGN